MKLTCKLGVWFSLSGALCLQIVGAQATAKTYAAITDFTKVPATATTAEYYDHPTVKALAIKATIVAYRTQFAAATVKHSGTAGNYDFKLTALQEDDGETSYKVFVKGVQVGTTLQNTRIDGTTIKNYTPQIHVFKSAALSVNDEIRVESDVASNGLKPEGGVPGAPPAWARGRWTQLEVVPATGSSIKVGAIHDQSRLSIFSQPGNSRIEFNGANGKFGTLSVYSASGTLVKTLNSTGENLSWDKTNNLGKMVNPGIYAAVFISQGQQVSASFVVF